MRPRVARRIWAASSARPSATSSRLPLPIHGPRTRTTPPIARRRRPGRRSGPPRASSRAASQPPTHSQPTTPAPTATAPTIRPVDTSPNATEVRVVRRRWPMPTGVGSTRTGSASRTMPPRTMKAARPRTHVEGAAKHAASAVVSAAGRVTAPRWERPRGSVVRAPGPDLEFAECRLHELDLVAVASEVAVAERRLCRLEVSVGVVDQTRTSVGSPAGADGSGVADGPGAGEADGPGDGQGTARRRAGGSASSAASRSRRASPSEALQTTCRGDATTIRLELGNADPSTGDRPAGDRSANRRAGGRSGCRG